LDPQLVLVPGGGVRLDGQQLDVQVGGFAAATRRPAQRSAVQGLAFAEQQVIRLSLDPLAMLEAGALAPRSA
jgi:hypothetical protein